MKKIIALSICLSAFVSSLSSQNKYWIKFSNKNGTPYTIGNPSAFLTAKSILRRTTYNIPIDQSDLPVTPAYISQIAAVPNVTVLYASKWINGLVISVSNTLALNTINSFSFVSSNTPVNKIKLIKPHIAETENNMNKSAVSNTAANYAGRSYWQNNQLGVDCIHSLGYRGQGMTIAVLDAGFSNVNVNPVFDSLRNRNGILGTRDFVSGGNSVYEDDTHGAAVLSLMAAIKPNVILGTAPMADYWLLRTEDAASSPPNNESPSEEYNWIRGAEFADSVGVDILTTSLGYTTFDKSVFDHSFSQLDGRTIPMSVAATMAARKGMFVLNAAGNGGGSTWPKIGIPADADSICTVGAIDSLSRVANFSSVGPTADGRRKPDLCARGVLSWVSYQASGICQAGNGTSYATPLLAGAVACFWQAHKEFSNIKVLDTLRKKASHNLWPDNSIGWGIPNMCCIPVGIKENNKEQMNFNVIPNPFSGYLTVNVKGWTGKINIKIINTLGMVIKTITVNEFQEEIKFEMNEFSNGIYFIKVSGENGEAIKRVIKH